MSVSGVWPRWGRYATAAVGAAVIAWYAFVANSPVPVLDLFDLAVHETGHLLAGLLPRTVMFLAGSVAQVAVPLGLAWYFAARGDRAGGAFCLAWAGTSMWDVSVYIADAPVQSLPLVGGGQHDWAFLLSQWDLMHLADEIAGFVEYSGAVLAVTGIVVAAWWAGRGLLATDVERPTSLEPRPGVMARVGDPWFEAAEPPTH